jgi:hypothetical protein
LGTALALSAFYSLDTVLPQQAGAADVSEVQRQFDLLEDFMPILLWYFPLIMFSATCDMVLSPRRLPASNRDPANPPAR